MKMHVYFEIGQRLHLTMLLSGKEHAQLNMENQLIYRQYCLRPKC